MTEMELLHTYRVWSGQEKARNIPAIPIANLDVFEDEERLVNRLFFLVPKVSSGQLRCFFYYEDNFFAKGSGGELALVESSFHLYNLDPST